MSEAKAYLFDLSSRIYPACCYKALRQLCAENKNKPHNKADLEAFISRHTDLCRKLYRLQLKTIPHRLVTGVTEDVRIQAVHFLDDATRQLLFKADENGTKETQAVLRTLREVNDSALSIQLVLDSLQFAPYCYKELTEKEVNVLMNADKRLASQEWGNLDGFELTTASLLAEKPCLFLIKDKKIIDIILNAKPDLLNSQIKAVSNIFLDLVKVNNPILLERVFEYCTTQNMQREISDKAQPAYNEAFDNENVELLKIFLKYNVPVTFGMHGMIQKKTNTAFLADETVVKITAQCNELARKRKEENERYEKKRADRMAKQAAEDLEAQKQKEQAEKEIEAINTLDLDALNTFAESGIQIPSTSETDEAYMDVYQHKFVEFRKKFNQRFGLKGSLLLKTPPYGDVRNSVLHGVETRLGTQMSVESELDKYIKFFEHPALITVKNILDLVGDGDKLKLNEFKKHLLKFEYLDAIYESDIDRLAIIEKETLPEVILLDISFKNRLTELLAQKRQQMANLMSKKANITSAEQQQLDKLKELFKSPAVEKELSSAGISQPDESASPTTEQSSKKQSTKFFLTSFAVIGGISIATIAVTKLYNKHNLNKIKQAVSKIEELLDEYDEDEPEFIKQKQQIINSLGLQKYVSEIDERLKSIEPSEDTAATEIQ